MICFAEILESLERGEMKFDPLSGTSCSEDEEEEDEDEMKIKQEPGTNNLTNIKVRRGLIDFCHWKALCYCLHFEKNLHLLFVLDD